MKSIKVTISILFFILLSAGYVWAADYYVQQSVGNDANPGNGWGGVNALKTIQKAINSADANAGADTIHVAAGTYNEHIVLVSDVTLLGGYTSAGGSPRDRTANPTIIDGTLTGRPATIEDVSNVTIDGFWIQNGSVNDRGGGIYIRNSSSVTINDNLITSNTATGDWGGGIAVAESSTNVTITNNDITGNNTDTSGGGISFWNACTGKISGNTISDNTAGGDGGGIIIADCSGGVKVNNNTIGSDDLGNTAEVSGGGIMVDGNSTCEIDGNTIEANTATTYIGGGICVQDSEATINNNSIKSNTCDSWGGGIAVIYDSNIKITNNNSIEGNSAGGSGGGISFDFNCTGEVSGNTISNNIAGDNGGGIIVDGNSDIEIKNNTIGGEGQNDGNTAEGSGGGIMVVSNSPCVIDGNTIESNTATTFVGGGICINDSEATISNNNIKSNTCADWGGGIALYQAGTVLVTGNAITQNSAPSTTNGFGGGISFFDTSGGSVFKNTITNNTSTFGGDGIHIDTSNTLPIIGGSLGNCNHIYNNGNFDLCYDGGATVNAEYNDWNTLDATIISTRICGTGTVDFTPWADSNCSKAVNKTDISIKPWVVPSDGTIDAWTTYDIWIDNQCGGWWQVGDPPMYENEALIDGQPNRIYAQFRNTGTNSAFNIEATFYIEPNAAGGTNIDPNGDGSTSDMVGGFTPITASTQVVVHAAYPGVTDSDSDGKVDELAASASALVYVEWTPSAGSSHRCVAVVLKPENTDVNPGNNIGQENLHKFGTGCTSTSLPTPGEPFNYEAPIYNPHYPRGGYVEIQLDFEHWPTDAGWTAELMGDNIIQFDETELRRNVTLTMSYPSEAEPGQRGVLSVSVWLLDEDEPLGGFSIVVEVPEEAETYKFEDIPFQAYVELADPEGNLIESLIAHGLVSFKVSVDSSALEHTALVASHESEVLGGLVILELDEERRSFGRRDEAGNVNFNLAVLVKLPDGSQAPVNFLMKGVIPIEGDKVGDFHFGLIEPAPVGDPDNPLFLFTRNYVFSAPPCPQIGDTSGDGTISAFDATLILQFVVGLIDHFPASRLASPPDIIPRDYTLSVAEASAKVGQRVTAPVRIADATGLTAGGIRLTYDSRALKAVNVMPTLTLNGAYWEANTSLEGEVRFAFVTTKPSTGGGTLFNVEFEVLPATEGQVNPLILESVELAGSEIIHKVDGSITILPSRSLLLQNYPNPFNPETWIPYQLAEPSEVSIEIYGVSGRLVRTLKLGEQAARTYLSRDNAAYWDGRNLAGEPVTSGVYFYVLKTDSFSQVRKMAILK